MRPFRGWNRCCFDAILIPNLWQFVFVNIISSLICIIIFSLVVIIQPYKIYAQDSYVIRGNTAVIKSVIPEHVRDYVRVVSWHNGLKVITLGGKYSLMPSGDLVITNVNDDAAKATYYCTAVNTLTGEKYFSNPAKLFLKGKEY